MREVKFRYYDAANDVMIYASEEGAEFTIKDGKVKVRYQREKNIVRDGIEMDVPVWIDAEGDGMEFTGLKDKNGTEIYEGDILYERYEDAIEENGFGETKVEVAFKDSSFGWIGDITKRLNPFAIEPVGNFIVIGNIYENPELLK